MAKLKYPYLLAEMARHGEKQKELGELLGLSNSTICRKLSGQIEWSISEINTLCEHYKKSYEKLFK